MYIVKSCCAVTVLSFTYGGDGGVGRCIVIYSCSYAVLILQLIGVNLDQCAIPWDIFSVNEEAAAFFKFISAVLERLLQIVVNDNVAYDTGCAVGDGDFICIVPFAVNNCSGGEVADNVGISLDKFGDGAFGGCCEVG